MSQWNPRGVKNLNSRLSGFNTSSKNGLTQYQY
jgi:hypothetical protein